MSIVQVTRALAFGNEWARWCGIKNTDGDIDRVQYRLIKVVAMSDRAKRFNMPIQNLISSLNSVVLKTRYIYDYEIGQQIQYRGKWYIINNLTQMDSEDAFQSIYTFNPANYQDTVFELIEME